MCYLLYWHAGRAARGGGGGRRRAVDRTPPVTHFRRPWPCRRHSRRVLPPDPQRGGSPTLGNLQMAGLLWLHAWFAGSDLFWQSSVLFTWNFPIEAYWILSIVCCFSVYWFLLSFCFNGHMPIVGWHMRNVIIDCVCDYPLGNIIKIL